MNQMTPYSVKMNLILLSILLVAVGIISFILQYGLTVDVPQRVAQQQAEANKPCDQKCKEKNYDRGECVEGYDTASFTGIAVDCRGGFLYDILEGDCKSIKGGCCCFNKNQTMNTCDYRCKQKGYSSGKCVQGDGIYLRCGEGGVRGVVDWGECLEMFMNQPKGHLGDCCCYNSP